LYCGGAHRSTQPVSEVTDNVTKDVFEIWYIPESSSSAATRHNINVVNTKTFPFGHIISLVATFFENEFMDATYNTDTPLIC